MIESTGLKLSGLLLPAPLEAILTLPASLAAVITQYRVVSLIDQSPTSAAASMLRTAVTLPAAVRLSVTSKLECSALSAPPSECA